MSTSPAESITRLSSQQSGILENFREQVFAEGILHEGDSIGTTDSTLLRFLRARKFNLNESKKMLKNCQHWRETALGIGVDEIRKRLDPFDYPGRERVFKAWSMYFHKTDKKGRPVHIEAFGSLYLQELYKHVTPETVEYAIIANADSLTRDVLPAVSRAAGRNIDQSLAIIDLKDFGLSQFWQVKSLVQMSFQISQDYFPEAMGKLAIINAPPSFTVIWSIVKPWLAKETVEKVDILGKDYREVLLELIDADNLPTFLGGNCTCSDSGGCEFSSAGPWIEERLHAKKAESQSSEPSEDSTATSIPSEQTSGTHTRVEDRAETADVIPEKVVHSTSSVDVVTTPPHDAS